VHGAFTPLARSADRPDPLKLSSRGADLATALKVPEDTSDTVGQLCELYQDRISLLEPAIWDSECTESERVSAIQELSDALDVLEVEAIGVYLAGKRVSRADGIMFPSFCLLTHTLPTHFGWTEWTDEAIFYKRPRLHAWWELMQYKPPARKLAERIRQDVDALQIRWGVPVPTLARRTLPKHAV